MKCSNFRLTIHCLILSIHFITSYYKFNLAWVLSKGKGYSSTYLYKSKAAKHPTLFEIAVAARYCKLHFSKQRIKKVTIIPAPWETKSTRKLCNKSQKLSKANVVKNQKKNIIFMSKLAFSPDTWIKIIYIIIIYICSHNAAFEFGSGMWWLKKWTE